MTPDRQELEEQEKARKAHFAREAKRILSEPLVEGFLKEQEAECFEAFRRLPLDTKLEEYQVVHHDLLAVTRFKLKLETYIKEHEMVLLQERTKDVEGI